MNLKLLIFALLSICISSCGPSFPKGEGKIIVQENGSMDVNPTPENHQGYEVEVFKVRSNDIFYRVIYYTVESKEVKGYSSMLYIKDDFTELKRTWENDSTVKVVFPPSGGKRGFTATLTGNGTRSSLNID